MTTLSASRRPAAGGTPAEASHHFGMTDLGLVVMAVIWGVNYSVVKVGLTALPPLAFNGARILLAAVVLALVAATVRDAARPAGRDVRALLALGVLGNGLYQLLFIFGLARTRAGVAALIVAAGPAWIAIIGKLLGRGWPGARAWFGIGLQLVGVACVVGSTQGLGDAGGESLLGAVLIAGGSVAWAFFTVLLQPYTERVHPLQLSAITMASGAAVIVLVAVPDLLRISWGTVPGRAWASIAYAGIGALVIAYLLFYRGVRVLGPTRTAMYSNLQPVIALIVAAVALHEQPTTWQLVGAASIMGGLVVSRLVRPPAARTAAVADAEASTSVGA